MKRLLFILLCCFSTALLFAQNKGNIHGFVQSSDSIALEKATVSILDAQDSSVLSYTLTDSKGKFDFVRMPQHKDLLLYISHVNAHTFEKAFIIGDEGDIDMGTVRLSGKTLDEIVIIAQPPVRMNKDTLEYNANYFKTRPNANVEELLKQLPGLQVNMDGTIYYEGKEVSQVKVNGKDFFASDLRIATRNLDASLVKTVQVYRDRGESKKTVEDEENLPITINLKFKSEFLRTDFGKAYASGGSRDRYEAGGLFNTFRDTMQVSFIAYGNNVNRQSFDYNELNQHAGLGRAENYGFNDFGGQNYWGIGNDMAGGLNINNDWGKTTKLNVMYMYRFSKKESGNDGNTISRFDDVQQTAVYNNASHEKNSKHSLNTFLRHRFDTTAYFEFRPAISFDNNRNSSDFNSQTHTEEEPLTASISGNQGNNSGFSYSHSFNIEKQLSKQHVVSFNNNLNLNKNNSESSNDQSNVMYKTDDPNTDIWENTVQHKRSNSVYLSTAYYNRMIEKLNFDLYFTFNAGKDSPMTTFYYNRNGSGVIHGVNYENNYRFSNQDYISGIKFNWKPIAKLFVNFGTAYQVKNTHFDFVSIDENRRSSQTYWLPNVNIRYRDLNLGWSKDIKNPQTYGIQTQKNDLNPTYTQLQSLDFDNIETQQAFISFNKYKQKIQFGSRLSLNYEDKSVGYRTWQDLTIGHTTSQRYQAASKYNISGYVYFRYNFKGKKDWQYYISTQPHLYSYENYQTINDVENKTTSVGMNFSQEFSVNWKNRIGVAPKYTLSINSNRNSVKDNPNFRETSYLTHDFGFGLNIYPIKGFSLEATYSLQNRANGLNSRQNYNIVNSSLYYTLKNSSQIKLSGFDILNQNVQNHWGMQGNATYYANSITLRQYFLLGYIHKFNFVKMKDSQ